MHFVERTVKDVAIVAVHGDITLNEGSDAELKDKVRSLLDQGRRKLILDLSNVGYIDSAGLGELVQAYATTTKQGGTLKLLGPPRRLKDLLAVTKLVPVFEAFQGEDAAVASFYPAAR